MDNQPEPVREQRAQHRPHQSVIQRLLPWSHGFDVVKEDRQRFRARVEGFAESHGRCVGSAYDLKALHVVSDSDEIADAGFGESDSGSREFQFAVETWGSRFGEQKTGGIGAGVCRVRTDERRGTY
jgi:hypothetical protein